MWFTRLDGDSYGSRGGDSYESGHGDSSRGGKGDCPGTSMACLTLAFLWMRRGTQSLYLGVGWPVHATAMETSALIFPQPDGIENTSNNTDERVQGLVYHYKRVRNFS